MTLAEILISLLPGFLLASGVEPLLAKGRVDLPSYRRHLRIFVTLASSSLGALLMLGRGHMGQGRWGSWLLMILGSAAGLTFITLPDYAPATSWLGAGTAATPRDLTHPGH